MTLMKSLLLGSAAGIVAVATAQAADLPTRKAAPVEYVRVCNVGGITGWTLPGSDTCVKFSGYVTAHFIAGNLSNQYNSAGAIASTIEAATDPFASAHLSQVLMVQGGDAGGPAGVGVFNGSALPITLPSGVVVAPGAGIPGAVLPNQKNAIFNRNAIGWNVRANLGFDLASNTAYGPLIGHFDINSDIGNGFDSPNGSATYVNTGYVTWAGITAGKAQSFFSFIGGGDNWNNFFSPDRKGFNEPNLLAYTASFGGGFTATLSAESQGTAGSSGGGTNMTGGYSSGGNGPVVAGPTTFGGQRWPDIVGALHVKQGWGEAQISGVIHNVNVKDYAFQDTISCGLLGAALCGASESKVGWGIDAGVKLNLTGWGFFGAGDDIIVTGAYTQNAVWYSGLPDAMNGENGQTNGNGQPMILADAYFNPITNSWSTPRAWSVSALLEHHWTPTFYTDLEASVGAINWSNMNGSSCGLFVGGCVGTGVLSPHAVTFLVGADIGWNPVTNLNFDLELMYQHVNQDRPTALIGTVLNTGAFIPGQWEGDSSGFQGRLRITRYF
jgi:Porin subfamily